MYVFSVIVSAYCTIKDPLKVLHITFIASNHMCLRQCVKEGEKCLPACRVYLRGRFWRLPRTDLYSDEP